jgi:diguanylate cyclase (GGDEF)-like protein/PAS domain S-box-containing protein
MEFDLELHEGLVVYRLIAESSNDVILKTDCRGFIEDATDVLPRMGFDTSETLIGPHLLDLVEAPFRDGVRKAFGAALAGRSREEWTEFRAAGRGRTRDWFAIRLGALGNTMGKPCGTLGIVRNLGGAKELEERLFRAEFTDPLTGLTNRPAWLQILRHLSQGQSPAILALVDIDWFKAINLHYGNAAGDRFLVDFADFLRGLTPSDVSLSRVAGSRFGMLFCGWSIQQSEQVCRDIVQVLADMRCTDRQNRFSITASVGIARVSADVDATIMAAESALRLSRAKGGNTVTAARDCASAAAPMALR